MKRKVTLKSEVILKNEEKGHPRPVANHPPLVTLLKTGMTNRVESGELQDNEIKANLKGEHKEFCIYFANQDNTVQNSSSTSSTMTVSAPKASLESQNPPLWSLRLSIFCSTSAS
ncbi:hypothetical protein Y1Q_0021401 [Alligator mississippiensis]|uniref:Uncharacterized protein n=1 Tax=Alligator mississippiensis TaxID=8496 RepID=A0A151PA02_ALLMI|nr:hypothetical protein Y1Q_0021401 [Alligator mississippiensis]